MLPKIGQYATLDVVKELPFGIYLDAGPLGEILLPIRYVPEGTEIGDELDVFIYCDSEDRLIATTLKPAVTAGQFAYLEVVDTSEYGAFMEWGIPKHLFVPYREQDIPMVKGRSYVVHVYVDDQSERIVASSRLKRHIAYEEVKGLKIGQEVDILVAKRTDLGFKVIVNQTYWGLIYSNEVFQSLRAGSEMKAFVKNIRDRVKIDISLQQQGMAGMSDSGKLLLQAIEKNGGILPLTDKSKPEEIYKMLRMSKKAFKRAVGNLYKKRLIVINKKEIRLKE